jgi:hypothetical protein
MKVKILLTFLFVAAFMLNATAQTIITGRVINEHDEAIEYATIALSGDSIGTLADAQGRFSLTIPKGIKSDLSISHVSYERAIIPYSTYNNGKQLVIKLKDKNVELSEVVIGKKNKLKTILGKKLPGPTGSFRGKGQENWIEWGPTFKSKKDWVVSDIMFTIKKCTHERCVLSFSIYEKRGNEWVNILNKPIYKVVNKTSRKVKLDVKPSENIILKAGKQYYVSVSVVDSDDYGILEFDSQLRNCIARHLSKDRTRRIPAGPAITLMGYELQQ